MPTQPKVVKRTTTTVEEFLDVETEADELEHEDAEEDREPEEESDQEDDEEEEARPSKKRR